MLDGIASNTLIFSCKTGLLAAALLASQGCFNPEDSDGAGASDSTVEMPESPVPTASCSPAEHRIDLGAARQMTIAEFASSGAARSGANACPTAHSNARVRYVSAASGNDGNDGTEDSPWQSLQHAADVVEPGTTVLVDNSGAYNGGLDLHRSGQPDASIIFAAQDASRPPRLVGAPDRDAVVDIDASYVVLQNFVIADHRRSSLDDDAIGIQIEPRSGNISNIEIRGNVIRDIGPGQLDVDECYYNGHGIIAQAEGHQISDLTIDGNELHDLYVGNSECLVVNGNVAGFAVTNNYIHDVDNIAIDIIGYEKNDSETARNGLIADNIVLDASNYWPYCSRGNCTYPDADESSDGIYVDGAADLIIEHNVVGRADHGIELQSENNELIRRVEVRFNVVFNSNYRNFTLGDSTESTAHDNLFFDDPALADADLESCK